MEYSSTYVKQLEDRIRNLSNQVANKDQKLDKAKDLLVSAKEKLLRGMNKISEQERDIDHLSDELDHTDGLLKDLLVHTTELAIDRMNQSTLIQKLNEENEELFQKSNRYYFSAIQNQEELVATVAKYEEVKDLLAEAGKEIYRLTSDLTTKSSMVNHSHNEIRRLERLASDNEEMYKEAVRNHNRLYNTFTKFKEIAVQSGYLTKTQVEYMLSESRSSS